jgi:hypothetical protein
MQEERMVQPNVIPGKQGTDVTVTGVRRVTRAAPVFKLCGGSFGKALPGTRATAVDAFRLRCAGLGHWLA